MRETKDGIVLRVKISPSASKNEIIKSEDGIKVKITAPPVDGKANKCLVEYLSKLLKVPKTSIEILRGETAREKTLLLKVFNDDKIKFVKTILE